MADEQATRLQVTVEGTTTLLDMETWVTTARVLGFPDHAPVNLQFKEARVTWWIKSVARHVS